MVFGKYTGLAYRKLNSGAGFKIQPCSYMCRLVNSFYLNGEGTGRGYETFTAVELPAYCQKTFGLSDKPEDNFIGGLSQVDLEQFIQH